jgi:hypothetical protein
LTVETEVDLNKNCKRKETVALLEYDEVGFFETAL